MGWIDPMKMGKKNFGYWIQGSEIMTGSLAYFSNVGELKHRIESDLKEGYTL